MQNKLWMKRVQINKELSDLIAKPLRSHQEVTEPSERLKLLLGMKERANGANYRAYHKLLPRYGHKHRQLAVGRDSRTVCHRAITSHVIKAPVQHEQGD